MRPGPQPQSTLKKKWGEKMPKCPECKAEIKILWRFVKTELKLVLCLDAQGNIQQTEESHEDECESYICPACQADLPISDFCQAVVFLREEEGGKTG